MNKRYNAGLYIRLSVEDSQNSQKRGKGNPFADTSESVENQRVILTEYAQLRGWDIYNIYIDDGFSGGRYDNRPAFQEMVADARNGFVNLILTKDLSRLGRDYIETGRYTDEVFPALGVRFIALMDNIDSDGNDDILPFRSLLNDYHLKDLSRKIKSVLRAKAENGGYVGAYAPYGYAKNPDCPSRLAVDGYAAEVVRRIFKLRAMCVSHGKIAAALNVDGILPPREYCYYLQGKRNPYDVHAVWQSATIKVILRNETYLGHSVKFKKGTQSYKDKTKVRRAEADWVRCENTHEPIIGKELWDAARSADERFYAENPHCNGNPRSDGKPKYATPLFKGLVRCAGCGSTLIGTSSRRYRKDGGFTDYTTYTCCLYSRTARSVCSAHSISELALLEIVRSDIRRHLEQAGVTTAGTVSGAGAERGVGAVNKERVVGEIQRRLSETSLCELQHALATVTARLDALADKTTKLYEDRLNGVINTDTFKSLSAPYEAERVQQQAEHDRLTKAVADFEKQTRNTQSWLEGIRAFLSLEKPDNQTLAALIEKIEVGENEGTRKCKKQSVRIVYRFVGRVE